MNDADGVGRTGGGIGSGSGAGGRGSTGGTCTLGRFGAGALAVEVGVALVRVVFRGRALDFFARAFFLVAALLVGVAPAFLAGFDFFAAIPPPYFTSAASLIIPS